MKQFLIDILNFLLSMVKTLPGTLKKTFCFEGRSSRKELWSYVFAYDIVWILIFLLCLLFREEVATVLFILFSIIMLLLMIPMISLVIRRFHDLNLSGFWYWYLLPCVGLPVIYTTAILELDPSAERVIGRISKFSSPWLSWILALILWAGSALGFLMLFFYPGKKEANDFGESPCAK